jgi:hypothetical protein
LPPLEAWEKVYIKLGSKDSVEELDLHFELRTCEQCHGGDPNAETCAEAHEGLVADPASQENSACADCHQGIHEQFVQSMHSNVWGMKNGLSKRLGVPFNECPAQVQEGFKGECGKCHAGCGDCHVSRPDQSGKGFVKGHKFTAKPHQKNQCMACHGSRIEHDFLGDDEVGRAPDIHFVKGMSCTSCHTGAQLHFAAAEDFTRYDVSHLQCEDCHDVATANPYHGIHWDDVSCHACHAQAYNNCTACHVDEAWKTDQEYQENNPWEDFRIGIDPSPEARFKFVTVRHAPVARDTFDNWGGPGVAQNFDDHPTWKTTTPHSIRRWTTRTEVADGAGCGANCHVGSPGGSQENVKWYLTKEYVEANWPDEVTANGPVYVDGNVPDNWQIAE